MEELKNKKCRFCNYPLADATPITDLQGNKSAACKNCGNVTLFETPGLGKLCPRCGDRMEDRENRGKVFQCKPCGLFVHDDDIYYSSPKGNRLLNN